MDNIKLKQFKFCGVKNIVNEMEIKFLEKRRENTQIDDLKGNLIKAIYGPNGSGKTAFVEAIALYKSLTLNNTYLVQGEKIIESLFNYACGKIILEATFIYNKRKVKVGQEIKHKLVIKKKDKRFIVESEMVSQNDKIIIEIKNGKMLLPTEGLLYEKSFNTLEDSPITALVGNNKNNLLADISDLFTKNLLKEKSPENTIGYLLFFTSRILIVKEGKDDHLPYILDKVKKEDENEVKSALINLNSNIIHQTGFNDISSEFGILKGTDSDEIERVKSEIKNKFMEVTKFLQIFKPNLVDFKVEFFDEKDRIVTQKKLEYKDYTIDFEFESVGIKKLVQLYEVVYELVNHKKIVFIDELDSHLHDVALNTLIQYIIDKEEGQFIFTTHTLSTMESLKQIKGAIELLDLKGKHHTWKQTGNHSPANLYKNGYLTGDFKYGVFDFDDIFSKATDE